MRIAKETWVIAGIGLLDLATTIVFIQHHGAEEANPLFRRYWQMGVPAFVGAKLVLLFCPLAVLEWARQRRPRFVSGALRLGIAGYVAMYGVGFTQLNAQAVASKNSAAVIREAALPPHPHEIRARLVLWHASHGETGTPPFDVHPSLSETLEASAK